MTTIHDCTINILPEFRTEFGNVLNVEVAFTTSGEDFHPEKEIRLVFTKNNTSFNPPPGALSPPGVSKQEPDQYLVKWVLHTELLGEGAFEVQVVTGKGKSSQNLTDKPERLFVVPSVAQEIRKATGKQVSEFASQMYQENGAPPAEIDINVKGVTRISGVPSTTPPTDDIYLWLAILKSTDNLEFPKFKRFVDSLCNTNTSDDDNFREMQDRRRSPFTGADGYFDLKAAAESFVMVNCGVKLNDPIVDVNSKKLTETLSFDDYAGRLAQISFNTPLDAGTLNALAGQYLQPYAGNNISLPYLSVIAQRAGANSEIVRQQCASSDNEKLIWCYDLICKKLSNPCLFELIWSYWHEEGMLVQTINAIARRFQNIRTPGMRDPLTGLEVSFLRPLNNLLWGYIQDDQHRLSVMRRNYEYDHHYGISLRGNAVGKFNPADSRSKFTAAFNHLLSTTAHFYEQSNNTMIVPDAFPVLNALKELHFILSEGAHNQYGDLPSTARVEMLIQQWILSQQEFSQFLPTRASVAYPEAWMDRVSTMNSLQGWNNPPILNFFQLANCGERIVLSVRLGHWMPVTDANQAANWAKFFRAEIQQYIHAYRAVTGLDLSAKPADGKIDATLPSDLLAARRRG
ncbi:MAG: hypothetical protein ACKVT2_22390 [Saprospiraceae bacterium]